ncbi:DUF3221 domain-containing protein [Bacillus thuringiensis]|nr:DUF3221 domain-containing protein [Bacillus thuringiensis]
MFFKKIGLITTVTTLTLGCGIVFGSTSTFADSTNVFSPSPIEDEARIQIPFTGYVISVDSHHLIIVDASTKEEALSYQDNWWKLISQNKILKVPILNSEHYTLGEKLHIYAAAWTKSLPPIAISPVIEKAIN